MKKILVSIIFSTSLVNAVVLPYDEIKGKVLYEKKKHGVVNYKMIPKCPDFRVMNYIKRDYKKYIFESKLSICVLPDGNLKYKSMIIEKEPSIFIEKKIIGQYDHKE